MVQEGEETPAPAVEDRGERRKLLRWRRGRMIYEGGRSTEESEIG